MSDQASTSSTESPFGRKIKRLALLLAALIGLVVLVWFIAAHFYQRALDEGRAALAAQGVTIACAQENLAGFPARFEWSCPAMTISLANGTTISGGDLGTVAPLWNPLLTIVEWQGPFRAINGPDVDVEVRSNLLRASIRLDTSLSLQRFSAVLDPLEIVLQGAPQAIAAAQQAELHVRQAVDGPASPEDLEVAALVLDVESLFLTAAQRTDLSITAIVQQLAAVRASTAQEALRQWVARSGEVAPLAVRLRMDQHAVNLDGDLALTMDGLINFDGNLATNDVGQLATLMGAGENAPAIAAAARLIGQEVMIEDETATQVPVRVDQGAITLGPLPMGQLQPLRF